MDPRYSKPVFGGRQTKTLSPSCRLTRHTPFPLTLFQTMWLTTRLPPKEKGCSTNGIWHNGMMMPRNRGSNRTISLDSSLGEEDDVEEMKDCSRPCHSGEPDCVHPHAHVDYKDDDGDDDDGDTSIMTSLSSHDDSNDCHDEFVATTRTHLSYEASSIMTMDVKKHTTKKVHFSTVEVREYARCASDNPAVGGGVPIGLDWNVVVYHSSVPLDTYEEAYHHPQVHHDRITRMAKLRLTGVERADLLRGHCGLTSTDLRNLEYRVAVSRMQRDATIFHLQRQTRQRQFFHRFIPRTMLLLPTQKLIR